MKRSLARTIVYRLLAAYVGITAGVFIGFLVMHFGGVEQSGEPQATVTRAPGWQQTMTPAETARWLTPDCKITALWDRQQIPGSMIVRNDITSAVSKVSFADGYKESELGHLWVIAFCGDVA